MPVVRHRARRGTARLREDCVELDLPWIAKTTLIALLDGDGEGGQTDKTKVPDPPVAPVTRPVISGSYGPRLLWGEATNPTGVAPGQLLRRQNEVVVASITDLRRHLSEVAFAKTLRPQDADYRGRLLE